MSNAKMSIFIALFYLLISCLTLNPARAVSPPETAAKKAGAAKATEPPSDYQLYLKSGDRSSAWNEFIEAAFDSFDSGNMATAYVFLKRAYDAGCRDGLLLFRLGIYNEMQGRTKDAADQLMQAAEKIPQQYPSHPLAKGIHEHAGRALYKADDFDRALPEIQKALAEKPNDFLLLVMAGQILRTQKQYADARTLFERAFSAPLPEGADPNVKQKLMKELVTTACESKDLDACLFYADKALEINPADQAARAYKQKIIQDKQKKKEMEMIEKIVK